jgi:hypothetical protein
MGINFQCDWEIKGISRWECWLSQLNLEFQKKDFIVARYYSDEILVLRTVENIDRD